MWPVNEWKPKECILQFDWKNTVSFFTHIYKVVVIGSSIKFRKKIVQTMSIFSLIYVCLCMHTHMFLDL